MPGGIKGEDISGFPKMQVHHHGNHSSIDRHLRIQHGQSLLGKINRLNDPGVGSAATQMTVQCSQDSVLIWLEGLLEHHDHRNQNAIDAIATLRSLNIDERLANHCAHLAGDQVLNRFHRLVGNRPQGGVARCHRTSIQRNMARTAVATAATKARSLALKLVTQGIQKR